MFNKYTECSCISIDVITKDSNDNIIPIYSSIVDTDDIDSIKNNLKNLIQDTEIEFTNIDDNFISINNFYFKDLTSLLGEITNNNFLRTIYDTQETPLFKIVIRIGTFLRDNTRYVN